MSASARARARKRSGEGFQSYHPGLVREMGIVVFFVCISGKWRCHIRHMKMCVATRRVGMCGIDLFRCWLRWGE